MKRRMLIIHPKDNVGVVLEQTQKNEVVSFEGNEVVAKEKIEFAHKVALEAIATGEYITKYGEVIGYALKDIEKGEWIHTHNMDDERGREGRLI